MCEIPHQDLEADEYEDFPLNAHVEVTCPEPLYVNGETIPTGTVLVGVVRAFRDGTKFIKEERKSGGLMIYPWGFKKWQVQLADQSCLPTRS